MIVEMTPSITLYYRDLGQFAALHNLGYEFKKRGFKPQYSKNLNSQSDIGIYACDANSFYNFEKGEWDKPRSVLSIFLIHDLNQHNDSEYKHFITDPLKVFDLALFPSAIWIEWLEESGKYADTRPRIGSAVVGYPKSDDLFNADGTFAVNYLDSNKDHETVKILVAPSWQSRHVVHDLEVLLDDPRFQVSFKSPEWEDDFETKVFGPWKEVLLAQRIESKYVEDLVRSDSRFVSLPNDIDIFSAIKEADLIISNGSNVLFEGLICERPGINVTNWLHPAGENGEHSSKAYVDFAGIISGNSKDLRALVDLAMSDQIVPLVKEGKSRLVSQKTLGKASYLSAELIIDTYKKLVSEESVDLSINFTAASKIWTNSELELAQTRILERIAQNRKLLSANPPNVAVAERDSILNSTIWSLFTPYRKAKNLFRKS